MMVTNFTSLLELLGWFEICVLMNYLSSYIKTHPGQNRGRSVEIFGGYISKILGGVIMEDVIRKIEIIDKRKALKKLIPELRKIVPENFKIKYEDVDNPLTPFVHCKILLTDDWVLEGQTDIDHDYFYGWELWQFDSKVRINLPFYGPDSYRDLKKLMDNWKKISCLLRIAEELMVPNTGEEEED